ncbi:MAG TPA: sn-glycerol-3-phosphate ABC transporter ATP-binding protein UgpC [Anaerolineae bacterium]|nr:sn-glycerol-3-phosphate ABC transporter ATP-binding protein UgpC [Anaerolineae bacterium]
MASVTYDHVTKRFGGGKQGDGKGVVAVRDLDILIADREFLVFVGPSGCGKTTCLRMLAGLEEITEGQILISDRVVNDVPPKDRDIAMVFQSYALYPHMSVYDNMAFALKLRKMPKAEIDQRVKRAADILGIGNLLDRKPKQLSGGQRQRVAVGRAIVREPKVFLFDEPLSNLDAKLRVQTRAEIIKLHQQLGTTFIYVTHDQTEAMTMGTRIAVLKDGVLQQCDTPQRLYDKPDNMFVAGFIGSPSMNFFDATIARGDGGLKAVGKEGRFEVPVPPDRREPLQGYIDRTVVLGIRPEDIHDIAFTPPGIRSALIEAQVDVTELMGNEVFLYLITGGTNYVARVDPRTQARVGATIQVAANLDNIHFFDKETEKVLR